MTVSEALLRDCGLVVKVYNSIYIPYVYCILHIVYRIQYIYYMWSILDAYRIHDTVITFSRSSTNNSGLYYAEVFRYNIHTRLYHGIVLNVVKLNLVQSIDQYTWIECF